MHKEYFETTDIFDKNGNVIPFGWSKNCVFNYNKYLNTASGIRVKETDTYCIRNSSFCMTISISNLGLYGVVSGTLIDFSTFKAGSNTVRKLLPFIRFRMPESSLSGDVAYNDSRIGMKFSKSANKRFLKCDFLNFDNNRNLYFNIDIDENNSDSMNTAISFEHSSTSYFTKRFLPQMKAHGIVRFGGNEYNLDKEDTTAFLLWSRLSVPNKTYYHELIAEGLYKNSKMTIHFCGGLSRKSEGIENCIFINGKLIKLGAVKVKGKSKDVKSVLRFESADKKIHFEFVPSTKGGGHINSKNDKKTMVYGNVYGYITGDDKKIQIDGFDTLMINTVL